MQFPIKGAYLVRVSIYQRETLFLTRCPELPGMIASARELQTLIDKLPEVIGEFFRLVEQPVVILPLETELFSSEKIHRFVCIPKDLLAERTAP